MLFIFQASPLISYFWLTDAVIVEHHPTLILRFFLCFFASLSRALLFVLWFFCYCCCYIWMMRFFGSFTVFTFHFDIIIWYGITPINSRECQRRNLNYHWFFFCMFYSMATRDFYWKKADSWEQCSHSSDPVNLTNMFTSRCS